MLYVTLVLPVILVVIVAVEPLLFVIDKVPIDAVPLVWHVIVLDPKVVPVISMLLPNDESNFVCMVVQAPPDSS
jgi:hypothetical protein